MKKFKLIYIPVAIMLVLGSLMIGITDYISMGFNTEFLGKSDWWANIISTNVGIICLIISILLIRNDNYKQTDPDYIDTKNKIDTFYKTKYVSPVFKLFCAEDNFKTKVIVYKDKINKQFSKLKPTKEDLDIYYSGTPEQKASNKYCTQVEYFNTLLSQTYINDNVPRLKIRYPKIDESLIFIGCKSDKDSIPYITKNKTFKIVLDLLPKFLFSFSLTFMIALLAPDFKDGVTSAVIFKTIVKSFTILTQIYFAYNYSSRYNVEVTLHDIQFRNNKLNEYIIWENKRIQSLKKDKEE